MTFKFVLYFLVFVAIIEASTLVSKTVRRSKHDLKTILDHAHQRFKRDILSDLPAIIQCSTNCIVPIIASIVQESMNYNSRPAIGPGFGSNQMNQQDMEEYCRIFRNASTCSEACPSQSFRDTIRDATALPRFICVERYQDFQRHLPCLNQVGMESDERCSSQCARYDSMESYIIAQINQTQRQFQQPGTDGSNGWDRFFGDLIKQSCQYSDCLLNCQKQLVTTRCGPEAQRLMEDMISQSFKSMDELSGAIGLNIDLPPECVQIQSGTSNGTFGNGSFPQPPPNGFFQPGQPFNNNNNNNNNQFQQQGFQQQPQNPGFQQNQGFPPQQQNQGFPPQQQQNQGYPQQQNQGYPPQQQQNQGFLFNPQRPGYPPQPQNQGQGQQYQQQSMSGIMTGVGRQGR